MTQIHRLFKNWISLTLVFITAAVFLVAAVVLSRFDSFEHDLRSARLQLVEIQTLKLIRTLSDELYLNLDTLSLHQRDLQNVLDKKGKVDLVFYPLKSAKSDTCPSVKSTREKSSLPFSMSFGDLQLGELCVSVTWLRTSWQETLSIAWPSILVVTLLLFCVWFVVSFFVRRYIFEPALDRYVKLERQSAVANLTQMLAHDIRKPFSLLNMTFELLKSAKSKEELNLVLETAGSEMKRNVAYVDGLIKDVMEAGAQTSLTTQPVDLRALLEITIREQFVVYPNAGVQVEYDIRHQGELRVDAHKFQRVVANIVSNAIQAMSSGGKIVFSSRDVKLEGKPCIEISISNSGKAIPVEDRDLIFESFYTKNKPGGTGLGLAIVRKIVTEHKGQIRCTHIDGFGPNFVMQIP